ncbi:hypothetical protein HRF29_05250 [Rathayibacter agropyri]|nr:hypothetical protein [Rathayibacter agropyri]
MVLFSCALAWTARDLIVANGSFSSAVMVSSVWTRARSKKTWLKSRLT